MPIDPEGVGRELEAQLDEIETYLDESEELTAAYQEALDEEHTNRTASEIQEVLSDIEYPGALPTTEFDEYDSLVVPFSPSSGWDSHEAANQWAREALEGIPTIAVDGSQLGPTDQFNIPLGYIQAAWFINRHRPEGDADRGLIPRLLSPLDVTTEAPTGRRYVDSEQVSHYRYELEGNTFVEQIERVSEMEPTPVLIYDGSLLLSYITSKPPEIRERYYETMSRILAASKAHGVPVVGYIAGSTASEVAMTTRHLADALPQKEQLVLDTHIFSQTLTSWGDRTVAFQSQRDRSLAGLTTTYNGQSFDFSEDLFFTYIDVAGTGSLDRIEFPRWVYSSDMPDGDPMIEYVHNVIRGEAAVGRGYPESVQQADADAVISTEDRDRFLRLVQRFGEEYDIPIEWDQKRLAKEKRRR